MKDDADAEDPWQTSDLSGDTSNRGSGDLAAIGGDSSIDDMARTLSTFGMRLDALVTSTTSYRSAITDRLVEYADTVNRLVKNQSADLEEHRAANQRLLNELQSGISASDASVSSLAARIDDLLKESTLDGSQEVLTEVRSILEAQERLGQFLTEALDQFGDRVTERLDDSVVEERLQALTGSLASIEDSDVTVAAGIDALKADIASLRDNLVDLASGEVVGALWDEVRSLRAVVDTLGTTAAPTPEPAQAPLLAPERFAALDAVASDVARLRADLADGFVVEADDSLTDHLEEIRERLIELAAASAAPSPDIDAVARSVDEMRAALIQGVDARPTPELSDQLAQIRAAVESTSARLEEGLVVDVADNDVADRVAALRDEVTAELEAVRQILADSVDRPATDDDVEMVVDLDPVIELVGELRDEIRSIRGSAPVATAPASITGSESIDSLRDEVRALGDLPTTVAAALNAELVALRRRIKVRSEADVLTDDQLDRIAQAVADRLA